MSESAFGVDHGYDEFSKIALKPIKMPKLGFGGGAKPFKPTIGAQSANDAGKAVRAGAFKAKGGVVAGAKATPHTTISGLGSKIGSKVSGLSKPLGHSAGKSFAAGNTTMGNVQARMGQGAKRFGGALSAHPAATGGAVVGAGGVGIYGAGHHNGKPRWAQ